MYEMYADARNQCEFTIKDLAAKTNVAQLVKYNHHFEYAKRLLALALTRHSCFDNNFLSIFYLFYYSLIIYYS